MSQFKPVSDLLSAPGSKLEYLLERTRYLQSLTGKLRENIDPVISQHIAVANLHETTAIISADSPAWMSKSRYLAPVILQLLRQEPGLQGLNKVQFKVHVPDSPNSHRGEARRADLSASSSKVLESAASGISDPELANALRRLSQRGKARSD
ncbi:DciA family protein [Kaarinaea lacus]